MATVIDSLLVTLGLDASAFKKGTEAAKRSQKDLVAVTKKGNKELSDLDSKAAAARAKNAKEMQAQGKKAVETFSAMRNQALSLLAVFTAGMGIVAFAKSTVFTTAAIGRMSESLGISTKQLGGWNLAAEQVGGSAEGMMSDINNVSQALAQLKYKGELSGVLESFAFYGGDTDKIKDTESALFAIADLLHKNGNDPAKQRLMANDMGLNFASLNLLKQGSVALKEYLKEAAEKAGIDEKNAEIAIKAEKAFASLTVTLKRLGQEALFPLLEQWSKWVDEHQDDIVKGIREFIDGANEAAESVGGWRNVFLGLIGLKIMTSIVMPLLALGAALVRVAGGLASIARFGGLFAGLSLFSSNLNEGEDEKMASLRDQSKAGKTRGLRNNNPGNMRYSDFAKRHGAIGQDAQGFAIFPSMESGEAATKSLLGSYLSRGHDTIRKVISRYAPSSENNTDAYINAVSKRIGVGADDRLNASHISALSSSIFRHENGAAYSRSPMFGLTRGPMRLSGISNTSSSETHIGNINVYTQATDARGIAQSIRNELAAQANTGMQ